MSNITPTPVDLYTAIGICREIEAIIIPLGYHCALGGGCLHKSGARKDVDVLIYPHDIKKENIPHSEVIAKIHVASKITGYDDPASAPDKEVFVGLYAGKHRLDLFFLNK